MEDKENGFQIIRFLLDWLLRFTEQVTGLLRQAARISWNREEGFIMSGPAWLILFGLLAFALSGRFEAMLKAMGL